MTVRPNAWTGDRVRLRAVEPDDADFFRLMNDDSELQRGSSRTIPPLQSADSAREWATKQSMTRPSDDNIFWAIESLDGNLVGSIQTYGARLEHGHFHYGVEIARDYWGNGYASDALRILLNFMFTDRRYQKVTAIVWPFNEGSVAFHERFGFVCEGRRRRMRFTGGAYHDEIMFGMTVEEFQERYP